MGKMRLEGWYHVNKSSPQAAGARARELLRELGVREQDIVSLSCEPLWHTDGESNPTSWKVEYVAEVQV